MPRGLYARTLILVIAPMVLLQTVVAGVFMERHWQTVTQRMSKAVVADIAAIIEIIETYPQDPDYNNITDIASQTLQLNISIWPPDPFPPAAQKPFFSILDDVLREEITRQIGRPFWIDTLGDSDFLEIRIRLEKPEKVLRVVLRRNQAYASNTHIFLVWMVSTSLVLVLISILFLRNQIRPIQQLARAAESFGKGHDMPPDFRIRGAREVRQAGLAFLQMRERIERQIEQRTTMLAGVSHDLRTILTRFRLQIAMVNDPVLAKELEQDAEEMRQMLQGYLEFARGETGEEISSVNLSEALKRYSHEAGAKGKTYQVECRADLFIHVRENAFSRLIGNLVGNALRYAQKVNVKASSSGERLIITIDDDGQGIPVEKREEVFKPFLRLDESRNLDESGTGLGLAIARDIARNHGGDINLHESPLGGLRVIVTLPM